MTKIEKQICIDNILEGLEGNHIPYKHDKRRRIIYINDVDVTKLLLAALIEVMCQSVNTTSEIYKKNTEQIAVLTEENKVLKAHLRR